MCIQAYTVSAMALSAVTDGVSLPLNTVPGQTSDFSFWFQAEGRLWFQADGGVTALSQVVLLAFVPPRISAITTSVGSIPATCITIAASFMVTGLAAARQGLSLFLNGTVVGQITTVLGDTFSLTVNTVAFPYGNVAFAATTTAGGRTSNPSNPANVRFVPAGTYTLAGVVTGRTLTNVFIGGFTQASRPLTYTISKVSGPLSSGTIHRMPKAASPSPLRARTLARFRSRNSCACRPHDFKPLTKRLGMLPTWPCHDISLVRPLSRPGTGSETRISQSLSFSGIGLSTRGYDALSLSPP